MEKDTSDALTRREILAIGAFGVITALGLVRGLYLNATARQRLETDIPKVISQEAALNHENSLVEVCLKVNPSNCDVLASAVEADSETVNDTTTEMNEANATMHSVGSAAGELAFNTVVFGLIGGGVSQAVMATKYMRSRKNTDI